MLHTLVLEIDLHDVHEVSHLGKNEHPVVELLQLGQDAIQKLELPRRPKDPVVEANFIVVLQEHIWVVATLTQLHHQVVQGRIVHLPGVARAHQHCAPFGQSLVNELLPGRQLNLNHILCFVGELGRHFLLYSPQQEGPQHLVEAVDDQKLLFLRQLHIFSASLFGQSNRKPLFKVLAAAENFRQKEVQQGPQLTEIILKGRAS